MEYSFKELTDLKIGADLREESLIQVIKPGSVIYLQATPWLEQKSATDEQKPEPGMTDHL